MANARLDTPCSGGVSSGSGTELTRCPRCSVPFFHPPSMRGKIVHCPTCNQRFALKKQVK